MAGLRHGAQDLGGAVAARRLMLRRGRAHRLGREAAGAVRVDLERDDVADALVADRGEDRVAGGEGQVVEAVQDRLLDLLAGGREDRDPADRRAVGRPARALSGVRCGPGDMDVDRRRRSRRTCGLLLFPLLLAAESRHRPLTRRRTPTVECVRSPPFLTSPRCHRLVPRATGTGADRSGWHEEREHEGGERHAHRHATGAGDLDPRPGDHTRGGVAGARPRPCRGAALLLGRHARRRGRLHPRRGLRWA